MALSENKDKVARLYFEEWWSYQEIGDEFGVSREAVRQFLNRHFPERQPGRTFRMEVAAEERAEREAAKAEAAANQHFPPCIICGDLVTRNTGGRGPRKTCSSEHSKLWAKARFLLDPTLRQAQRQSAARSILRYQEERKPSQLRWAKKLLEGEHINTRTYVMEGSQARLAYDEVMRIREEKGYKP